MTENQTTETRAAASATDYVLLILAHKRFIARVTVCGMILSLIIAFALPKWYQSTTRILPPQQDPGILGLMMGQIGGATGGLASELLGKGKAADLYVGILKSETIKDIIIDRFKLMEIYDEKYRLDTYEKLDNNVSIEAGKKDGIISVAVEDKDPKRAAEMANAYVEALEKITVNMNSVSAIKSRPYLEERLANARSNLVTAEEKLKAFQIKNKSLDISEQAKGTIAGIAELMGKLAIQEAQLVVLKRQFTDSSQEVKIAQSTVSSLKKQISQMENEKRSGALPGIASVPNIGQEYVRLMRDFKIQETIVELLTKQYELDRLTEAKNIAPIQIIQKASIADKKSKPKRSVIVLAITIVSFSLSILCVFIQEQKKTLGNDELEKWNAIFQQLIKW